MIDKKIQSGGEGSLNIQGDDINLNVGITYGDARQIALDVFKSNFLELSQRASELAYARVQEMTDLYLNKLIQKDPALLKNAEDPDMQYALFTAQREYARTGNKDLADILVDILIDRASETERSVLQIVHNEALSVAPKLTADQFDVLSTVFILRYTRQLKIRNLEGLANYLKNSILPFTKEIRTDNSCFQHLEYAGCGSLQMLTTPVGQIFKSCYPGLFWRGANLDEIKSLADVNEIPPDFVIPCLNNSDLLQFNALNEDVLRQKCGVAGFGDDMVKRLLNFQNDHILNDDEVKNKLIEIVPESLDFLKGWDSTSISMFTLTSVGIAIAHANIRRRINDQFNINIWIK